MRLLEYVTRETLYFSSDEGYLWLASLGLMGPLNNAHYTEALHRAMVANHWPLVSMFLDDARIPGDVKSVALVNIAQVNMHQFDRLLNDHLFRQLIDYAIVQDDIPALQCVLPRMHHQAVIELVSESIDAESFGVVRHLLVQPQAADNGCLQRALEEAIVEDNRDVLDIILGGPDALIPYDDADWASFMGVKLLGAFGRRDFEFARMILDSGIPVLERAFVLREALGVQDIEVVKILLADNAARPEADQFNNALLDEIKDDLLAMGDIEIAQHVVPLVASHLDVEEDDLNHDQLLSELLHRMVHRTGSMLGLERDVRRIWVREGQSRETGLGRFCAGYLNQHGGYERTYELLASTSASGLFSNRGVRAEMVAFLGPLGDDEVLGDVSGPAAGSI